MNTPEIRIRSWVRASAAEERTGLLGYVSIRYGKMVLDGVCLRQTADGYYALSFPAKTDRGGRRHSYMRPEDDETRLAIEREVLRQLKRREDVVA